MTEDPGARTYRSAVSLALEGKLDDPSRQMSALSRLRSIYRETCVRACCPEKKGRASMSMSCNYTFQALQRDVGR